MTSFVEERVPYSRRIFCNRNLRMDRLRWIGFDMDYTLALYHEKMETLQAEMVMRRLVDEYGYPNAVLGLTYDPGFAIRGLVVDLAHGNVFKMDAHRFVGRTWHGDGPLDMEARKKTYTNRKVSPHDPNFAMVDTLFSLPEISLYSQLVAHFDALSTVSSPNYERIWQDLRQAMDALHRDGSLKAEIMRDLPAYIVKDPELAETLHRFRSAGKKLFVMTNSEPKYTEAVMTYLLDGAYAGYTNWKDYFNFTISSARKPMFFSGDHPFTEIAPDFSPIEGDVTSLRGDRIYSGGNLDDLTRMTGIRGDEVLYVGDHIYGDILRSKSVAYWRTAMIIQEMEQELHHVEAHAPELERIASLEEERFQLNLERAALALEGERDLALMERIRSLTREIHELERSTSDTHNPYWGSLFRDRTELSAFGAQAEDYACVYTSRVSNFRLYSPVWYFRSPRDRMAHELQAPRKPS